MPEQKTIKIGGKDVPLTKNGLPNRVHLSKEAREVVAQYAEEVRKQKKKVLLNELTEALKKLG